MTPTEINEACAKRLGWTQLFKGMNIGVEEMAGKKNPSDTFNTTVPNYCTDIQAALEIPGLESLVRLEDGRWSARFGGGATLNSYYEIGIYEDAKYSGVIDELPGKAIALAFLKLKDEG
jgi:hypothetical protein